MILLSIKNNNIILPRAELYHQENLFDYLWQLRHKNKDFTKRQFNSYFENINSQIPQLKKAILLAAEIILTHQTIGIIGDYDVDGTIATTLLTKFFNHLKFHMSFNFTYHIPNRFSEGYGPSIFSINHLHSQGVNLIITVDSGTTSIKEMDLANSLNMKSIVLDHHIVQSEIPNATCFVNCQNSKEFSYLCGSGLAFVFAIQLQKHLKTKVNFPSFDFSSLLDLVAVATVCDFVPLVHLNRNMVYFGLKLFNHLYLQAPNKLNKALHMILQYSMYNYNKNTYISSGDLGFAIGPYLNVAGRLEDANMIVKFLTCDSDTQLEEYFFKLQNLWRNRKSLQEDILHRLVVNESEKFILVYDANLHEGVMGIIAAKLKDKYNKPTIVISLNEEEGKGSIRSLKPFNAGEIIEIGIKENILIKGGGHEVAGGFSIKKNRIQDFHNLLVAHMSNMYISPHKDYKIDSILSLQGLNKEFYEKMEMIGPFGVANEEFLFFLPNLKIQSLFVINGKHISMQLTSITNSHTIRSIWFFASHLALETLRVNMSINVVANIKYINNKVELYVVDLMICHEDIIV